MKKYTIKKGKHRSGIYFGLRLRRISIGQIKFMIPKDSLYLINGLQQYQINKIGGWSLGLNHHNNSVRMGWYSGDPSRYQFETHYQAFLYYYNKGNRYSVMFETGLRYDKEYRVEMHFNSRNEFTGSNELNVYLFSGDNIIETVSVEFKMPFYLFTYGLYPYFGGKAPAPKDIDIYFEKEFI